MTLDNPIASKRRINTGTYAGDNNDNVQKVTGFKCALVIILGTTDHSAIMTAGHVVDIAGGSVRAGGSGIHASDGFVVYHTADLLNSTGWSYYWYAIEAD